MNFSDIASEIQQVGMIVIDETSCMTYVELAMWKALMEEILGTQHHVPLILATAGRMVTDIEKEGTVRCAQQELHLCMTLCENDVRPTTTCVRFSSGSSDPLQATPPKRARYFRARL